MGKGMTRRQALGAAGALAAGAAAPLAGAADEKPSRPAGAVRILGIACSPRKGKTTSTAVAAALEAAEKADPIIATELIDLGGTTMSGWQGGAAPKQGSPTDPAFAAILPKLRDPSVGGWIIGSPVYFRSMSALCKAFLEQCAVLRSPRLLLASKPLGALAVGAFRHGGQELVVQQIQTAMLCHEVAVVGGKPKAHQGATLWSRGKDDITGDELGMDTARKLGIRVAEAALELARFGGVE